MKMNPQEYKQDLLDAGYSPEEAIAMLNAEMQKRKAREPADKVKNSSIENNHRLHPKRNSYRGLRGGTW